MADWPSISAPRTIEEEYYKPQIKTEFEANYTQSRAASSRAIHRWNLSFVLSESDLGTLHTFFNTNLGIAFNWTNPRNSTTYSCRFSGDSIKSKSMGMSGSVNYWSVDITIEEI